MQMPEEWGVVGPPQKTPPAGGKSFCVMHPAACAKIAPTSPACSAPMVADSVTGACVVPCPDGSIPANSTCPPVIKATGPTTNPPSNAPAAQATSVSGDTVVAAVLGVIGVGAAGFYLLS